jgi:Holliday junction resolvase RusA-like endonuclease
MFLYDNTIVSEHYLKVQSEPVVDFYTESIECSKMLLTESVSASKRMLDVVTEYGSTKNIVTEAMSEWIDRIVKVLKEFKAKIIVLFRKWIDWIKRKLHMKTRYSDEAMQDMIDKSKSRLQGFSIELPEPIDYGFTYFNELTNPTFPRTVINTLIQLKSEYGNAVSDAKAHVMDIKTVRDELQNTTNGFVNGTKTMALNITIMENLLANKKKGKTDLDNYQKKVMDAIDAIEKDVKRMQNSARNIVVDDQNLVNAMLTLVTCLHSHLASMANAYPTYINNIDKAIMQFLPQAEQYLMAND